MPSISTDTGPFINDYAEAVREAVEKMFITERDPRITLRAAWVDRCRHAAGAVCILYTNSSQSNIEGKLLGLDWDLTKDPDGYNDDREIVPAEMGMSIYYRQIQEPPGRSFARAKYSQGIFWLTPSDEPPVVPPQFRPLA